MWYVLQVQTGSEESVRLQCEANIPKDILKSCFVPHCERKKKIQGQWSVITEKLFPGYILIETDDIQDLAVGLDHVMGMTKLLGTDDCVVPLTSEEVLLMERLTGRSDLVPMSEGIIAGDQIIVQQGPLQGLEGMICKVDRHKRKAWLKVDMFGREQEVEVGLEITKKIV